MTTPVERATAELLSRQAAMIAMLTGVLVNRGTLTKQEAIMIAEAGCGGSSPGPTPEQVMAWLKTEMDKRPEQPGATSARRPIPRG